MSEKKPPPDYAAYQKALQGEAWYKACEVMDAVCEMESPETFMDGPQPGSLAWRLHDSMQELMSLARNAADQSNIHMIMYFERFLKMMDQEREIAYLKGQVERVEALRDQYARDGAHEGYGGELWTTTAAALDAALADPLDGGGDEVPEEAVHQAGGEAGPGESHDAGS